jgi:hypothetical protein
MKLKAALVLAGLVLVGSAHAQQGRGDISSGNFYLPICKAYLKAGPKVPDWKLPMCVEVVDTITWFGSDFAPGLKICPPDRASADQSVRVVAAYLDANPARLYLPFRGLAFEALHNAWPCP